MLRGQSHRRQGPPRSRSPVLPGRVGTAVERKRPQRPRHERRSIGDTSFDARARLDYSLTDRPDLVVICLGSNDMFQGKRLEDLEANLTDIARRCRTAGARAVICRMRIFVNFGFGWTARYERIFPRAARAAGAALAPFPLEGVAAQPSMNLPDGIHPNPAGYEKFVDNIFETVEEEIKAIQRKKR
ncbi:MAG: arylesterase [Elusimicrobia bacterium]|nr:arylesterase [Elusimicrobiota bacterium]